VISDFATSKSAADNSLSFSRAQLGSIPPGAFVLGSRLLHSDRRDAMRHVPERVPLELLAPARATTDSWLTGQPIAAGQSGSVRFACDGHWVHGSAELEVAREPGSLEQAALRAYADLFAVLDRCGCPHLLRLWNYVPGINDDGNGLEQYRHFNAGRQQAFLAAGRSAFQGAPAACALGSHGGVLRVFFLAGREFPRAIENPRQVSAYHYPEQYGPRSPSFSRAALAELGGGRQMLFISGTASIVGHRSLHVGDVRLQVAETMANIEAVLQAAEGFAPAPIVSDALTYTLYLRRRDDLAMVIKMFEEHVGPGSFAARTAVYLLADVCRAELLVEIEAQGVVRSPFGP